MKQSPSRRLALRIVCPVWTTVPGTVRWIHHYRDKNRHIDYLLLRGINANLILASATCIEGFAVECLKAVIPAKRNRTQFEAALANDFYERAAKAGGFKAASDLYRVFAGKPLLELLPDNALAEAIRALFAFRNCLAHGKSPECRSYFVGSLWLDYELEHWGGYRTVEEYLLKRKLVSKRLTEGGSGWEFLTSEIADHFVNQMKPACNMIQGVLPNNAQKLISPFTKMAFEEEQRWSDP